MANATKYFAEFKDLTGQQWRINIHDELFGGATGTEFTTGSTGFEIQYKGDTENLFQSVIGSTVQFEFIEQTAAHTAFLNSLATAKESRYTITIEKLVSSVYQLHWFGVLLLDQWTKMNEPLPRSSLLTASDDLGNLTNVFYKQSTTTGYSGNAALTTHLLNCLNKTRALHPFGQNDVFLKIADDFRADNMTATERFLANMRTHHESFWNIKDDGTLEFMPVIDVLTSICTSQNARVFLADGIFYFIPIGAYQNDTEIVFHNYAIDGDFLSTSSAIETELAFGTDLKDLNGNEQRFTPPLNIARRQRDYNGNAPTLFVPSVAQSDFTTTITGLGIDYFAGTQIVFSGTVNLFLPAVSPLFGNGSNAINRIGRVGVNVEMKCGTKYSVSPLSFGDDASFWFDEFAVYEYSAAEYGANVWQNTAAPTTIVSSPFDRDAPNIITVPIGFTTAALPNAQSQLEITLSLNLIEHDGTISAIDSNLQGATYTFSAANLRAYKADEDGGGNSVTFSAFGDDANRSIKLDDTVVLGDKIGDSSRGVITVLNQTNFENATGWTSLNHTTPSVGINRLGVNEIMRAMRDPVSIQAGQMHVADPSTIGALVNFWNTLNIDGETYMFTEFSFSVNDRVIGFECARIQRSTTVITEDDGPVRDPKDDIKPTDTGPTAPDDNIGKSIAAVNSTAQTNKTDIASNDAEITALDSDVTAIKTVLKSSFTGGGAGIYVDSSKATNNSFVGLTSNSAKIQAGAGNTNLEITESSPGQIDFNVQIGPAGSEVTRQPLSIQGTTGSQLANIVFAGNVSGIDIGDLDDVTTSGVQTNQILAWNGTNFVPVNQSGGGGGSDTTAIELKTLFLEQ